MQRDLAAIHASVTSQLSQFTSGAWTSSGIVDDLTPQLLEGVHATFKDLDPLIRVRFLVACCLSPPSKKQALMPGLRKLIQLAKEDADEWVQALGHTINPHHASITLNAQSMQGVPPDVRPWPPADMVHAGVCKRYGVVMLQAIHATCKATSCRLRRPSGILSTRWTQFLPIQRIDCVQLLTRSYAPTQQQHLQLPPRSTHTLQCAITITR